MAPLVRICIMAALSLAVVPDPIARADAAFDFAIERSSKAIAVPQGFAGLVLGQATLRSGSPQDLALSASGPAGVTVAFAADAIRFHREGGRSPFISTVTATVATSATTPLGSHTVSIEATG